MNILSGSFIIQLVKLITCIWILLVTCFIVQMTGFNRPAKFVILLKHWGYDNFELNWFHGLSKSRAIPFSQVSADSFRFNIQKCSRSLYAFIAFRPTCFAWRLVMRNLHETSTQRARWLYPDSKNNSRRITYGIGCLFYPLLVQHKAWITCRWIYNITWNF